MRMVLHVGHEPLPEGVRGCCSPDSEMPGQYYILISSLISQREQEDAFLHELRHIWRGDFCRSDSVDGIETDCRKYAE